MDRSQRSWHLSAVRILALSLRNNRYTVMFNNANKYKYLDGNGSFKILLASSLYILFIATYRQ